MIAINDNQNGFTLLEIMVALFIFAMVTTLSLIGLKNVIDAQQIIERHVAQLHEMELSQLILQRDFDQIIDRPIIDQNNQIQPSVYGNNNYIEFTRAGYINPMAISDRSELQRVAYFVQNNQLIRRSWAELDRTQNTPVVDKVMMNNVINIKLRYLNYKGEFIDQWPAPNTQNISAAYNPAPPPTTINPTGSNPQQTQAQPNAANSNPQATPTTTNANQPPPPPTVPKAIEMIITINKLGQLDRIFAISGVGFNG